MNTVLWTYLTDLLLVNHYTAIIGLLILAAKQPRTEALNIDRIAPNPVYCVLL